MRQWPVEKPCASAQPHCAACPRCPARVPAWMAIADARRVLPSATNGPSGGGWTMRVSAAVGEGSGRQGGVGWEERAASACISSAVFRCSTPAELKRPRCHALTGAVGDHEPLEAQGAAQRALQQAPVHAAGLAVDCGSARWTGRRSGLGRLQGHGWPRPQQCAAHISRSAPCSLTPVVGAHEAGRGSVPGAGFKGLRQASLRGEGGLASACSMQHRPAGRRWAAEATAVCRRACSPAARCRACLCPRCAHQSCAASRRPRTLNRFR